MKGGKFVPPPYKTSVNFRVFEGLSVLQLASFQQMTLYSNLAVLKLKRAFSSGGRDGSSLTCPCQKVEKNPWKGLLYDESYEESSPRTI